MAVLRGVELRADTFRLWAREHRTRWSFRLHHPHFEAATESPDLGQALCDLARVCAVMAEPFGVPAGRVSSEVPGAHPGGPRPLPAASETVPLGAIPPRREPTPVPPNGDAPRDVAGESEAASDEGEDAESMAVAIGDGEEVLELSEDEREAIPSRSDDAS